MRVTILGSGSAMPSPTRVQAGVLLEPAGGPLLVDCGSGVLHRLAQTSVTHRDVDTVLLTHHHLDHVADLPGLVKARVLDGQPDLTVVGPPGTAAVCDQVLAVDDLRERAALQVREVTPADPPFDLAGLAIAHQETVHSTQCFAYRVGDRLAISGDTAPADPVAAFVAGVDTLIHECAYPDGTETEGHTTPTALGEALAGRGIDRVLLTHLFPAAEAVEATLADPVRARVDATVQVATDGRTLTVA